MLAQGDRGVVAGVLRPFRILRLPAKVVIDYDNVELFRPYAAPALPGPRFLGTGTGG